MRLLFLMVAAVALTGCETTLSEMRATETPRLSFNSAKSVDASVRCLTAAYAGLELTPNVIPTGEGFTITFPVANRMFVDVQPAGDGTKITYYRAGSLLLTGDYQRATETCRD